MRFSTTAYWAIAAALFSGAGCVGSRTAPKLDARYEPFENLLEVVSDIQRHANDNKASLVRLINFEKIYPRRMPDAVAYSKGICMERLGDYEGALKAFGSVAESASPLREEADRRVKILRKFNDLVGYQIQKANIGDYLTEMEFKLAEWGKLIDEVTGTPYEWLAREEEERAEAHLAEFAAQNYLVIKDGAESALNLYRQLTIKHTRSKNINIHYLNWADFCALLAKRYAQGIDPRSLSFGRDTFNKSADAAIRLYSLVAQKDGAPARQILRPPPTSSNTRRAPLRSPTCATPTISRGNTSFSRGWMIS
ncbi:MAG: hypothetical protein NT045_07760 [Candidatus Aureabacteria bacterium]|nr:hypothetical protein [Candidatus Auribacterota bacterium]